MPNYDYVCEKCEKEFEVFQSMNDPRLEDCLDEACEGRMRRKIGTGAGIIFKGSGFYETDYRSDSYKKGAKSESEKSSGGKSESSSSSEASSSSSAASSGSGDSKASTKKSSGSKGDSGGSSS